MTTYNITNNGTTKHVTKAYNTKHIFTSNTKLNNHNMNHLVLEVNKDIRGDIDLKEVYLDLWITKYDHRNKINLFIEDRRVWMKDKVPTFLNHNQKDIENNTDVLTEWVGKVRDYDVQVEIIEITEEEFISRITIEEKRNVKNNE